MHRQHQDAALDALRAHAVSPQRDVAVLGVLRVVLRMEHEVPVHVVELLLGRQDGVQMPVGAEPSRTALRLVVSLEVLFQDPVLHFIRTRGVGAGVVEVRPVVHVDRREPLGDLVLVDRGRDLFGLQVKLAPCLLHLGKELLQVLLVARRLFHVLLEGGVRGRGQGQQRLPRRAAEATAQQVVHDGDVADRRPQAIAKASLADHVQCSAPGKLPFLRQANAARLARHQRRPGDLRRVGPSSRRPPALGVALLELHEAILGFPVEVREARVVGGDDVLPLELLAARLACVVEGPSLVDALKHVPHAVDIGGLVAMILAVLKL
mmetsp:Transcript_11290/g.32231  ORF Transcript_11290/g.32231 Transcript_11290/m.32231 type:complete len:321 (+) Transcript_11290:341-1303(+)